MSRRRRCIDRRPRHDERSRNYPVRGLIPGTPEIKPKNWYAGAILDQGSEGSCVGHGWTTEQAHQFGQRCRTAGFSDVSIDRHRSGRRRVISVLAHTT